HVPSMLARGRHGRRQRKKIPDKARRGGLVRSDGQRPPVVKLLRTIRLDPSDTFVFELAAEPGEWAVSGAFVFWNSDPAALEGKARTAFRGGFLGLSTLGWSTLVQIVDATATDRQGGLKTRRGQRMGRLRRPTRGKPS